jgi:hypothetical protein
MLASCTCAARRGARLALIAVAFSALGGPPVRAAGPPCVAVCYVDAARGDDANGGASPGDPKRTITAALAQVARGGQVIVAAGEYTEALTLDRPVTLRGAGAGTPARGRVGAESVIRPAGGAPAVDLLADGVTIDGFAFDMGSTAAEWTVRGQGAPGGGPYQSVAVLNNAFTGASGGVYLADADGPRIEGNWFNALGGPGALLAGSSNGAIYRNNDSYRCIRANLEVRGGPHAGLMVENNRAVEDSAIVAGTRGGAVRGNSFDGAPDADSRLYLRGNVRGLVVQDNRFSDVPAQAILAAAGGDLGPNSDLLIVGNQIITTAAFQSGGSALIELRGVAGTSMVRGNTVRLVSDTPAGVAVHGIVVGGSATGAIVIDQNTLDGGGQGAAGSPPASGVYMRTNDPNLGPLLPGAAISVTENLIAGFGAAVAIYDPLGGGYGGLLPGVAVAVTGNSLAGSAAGLAGGPVPATCNWWGAPDGPRTPLNPGGAGAALFGATSPAQFAPWSVAGADADPAPGYQVPAYTLRPGGQPSPADNDFRRIANAVGCAADDQQITLAGVFDWTTPQAAASWKLGGDGVAGTDDDYSALVRAGVSGVALVAAPSGATIQGPGDLPDVSLESCLLFDGGPNQRWTIRGLRILDFDLSIGMFAGAGGVTAFSGTTIAGTTIRVPRDLSAAVAPADPLQNIGIHLSFGANQTIADNLIEIDGGGLSDPATGQRAASVGLQSNTSGGAVYDGLAIISNTLRVLSAPAPDPETVLGIWENGHAHTSAITVRGNRFENVAAGNDPRQNRQRAFRITSHSSETTAVTYAANSVQGANISFEWLAGRDFSAQRPVRLVGNLLAENAVGVLVQSGGQAAFRGGNRISGGGVGVLVAGPGVQVDLGDTAFSGQRGDYVTLDNAPNDVDARGATFEGRRGAALDAAQFAAVAAKITDRLDNPALGRVVLADPTVTVTPAALAFVVAVGAPRPPPQAVAVGNVPAAYGPLDWRLAVSYGPGASGWLGCTPPGGAGVLPGASVELSCGASGAGLAAGSYSAMLQIETSTLGAQGSPRPVAVTLQVVAPPELAFVPPAASVEAGRSARLSLRLNAPLPAAATVALSASDPAALVVPASVTIPAGASQIDIPIEGGQPGAVLVTAALPPWLGSGAAAAAVRVVPAGGAVYLPLVAA